LFNAIKKNLFRKEALTYGSDGSDLQGRIGSHLRINTPTPGVG